MESFLFKSAIRGYHVYKDIWTPSVDDKLSVKREFKNQFDHFAVKIILDGETVGHLPSTPGCRVLKSGTLTPAVCRGRTAVVLMNVRTSFQNGGRRSTLQCGEGCSSPS